MKKQTLSDKIRFGKLDCKATENLDWIEAKDAKKFIKSLKTQFKKWKPSNEWGSIDIIIDTEAGDKLI